MSLLPELRAPMLLGSMKRAVMTGGRKWPFHHRPEMRASLLLFRRAGVERLGQGEARGADRLAAELWAEPPGTAATSR